MIRQYDVAIVGAGPAGSAAATAMAQRGWAVLLLEQESLPRHKVCGEFLSPEAQQSLQRLGLYAQVNALAPVALYHAVLTAPAGRQLRVALPDYAWGVSRYALDDALATAAQVAGASVWTGVTVTQVATVAAGYTLHLRTTATDAAPSHPPTVWARSVILACGRHSRLSAPPSGHQAKVRYVGVKCHYSFPEKNFPAKSSPTSSSDRMEQNFSTARYAAGDLPAQVELFFFSGGYGGINPVENGCANLCLLVTYAAFQQAGKSPTALLEAASRLQPALAARLAHAHPLPATLKSVAAIDTAQPATPWQEAPCIGDAAAMITPLCGDGMAMALRGAELCVPLADAFLRGQISQVEWMQEYCRAWRGEFDRRLRLGRLLQSALARPHIADLLVGVGKLAPALATYLVGATRGPLVSARTG
ncbi:MAG: FAD-dependent monooxygenase [Caldilineaceae bacterium]